MMNQKLALEVLEALTSRGVREFIICPGARNSPLSAALSEVPWLRKFWHFEERSAAFFALGRIKAHGAPVAIVTTSGTAAGELLPATMEAHYAQLPLVLVTADRPRHYRGSGAPQTAEQVGIFGLYVESCRDVAAGERTELSHWSGERPLHLNVCFDEPLLDRSATDALAKFAANASSSAAPTQSDTLEDIRTKSREALDAFFSKTRHPLVLVGSVPAKDRPIVSNFLQTLGVPVYLEAQSGLREDPALEKIRVPFADGLLARATRADYPIDGVLRIGGVPTHRLWRDLEVENGRIPVLSFSNEPFSGLGWNTTHPNGIQFLGSPYALVEKRVIFEGADRLLEACRSAFQKVTEPLFERHPAAEPSLFRALSRAIPKRARIYMGNSLPIREWDLAATFEPRGFEMAASRGLNGIDGQISTFLGFAQPGAENWAVLGDLTSLYDLQGPWILSQLENTTANIVVVNNHGGKIFSRMFPQREFQNPHALEFSGWAKLWGLAYEKWEQVPSNLTSTTSRIIELVPNEEATALFWKELAESLK